MLKKYIWILLILITASFNAEALIFKQNTPHVNLSVIPEYQTLESNKTDITLLAKIEIAPGWHIYWQNPGDTGDPTTLTFFDTPYYNTSEQTRSAPQKIIFNELITTYLHHQQLYIKNKVALKDISAIKDLPFELVLSYSVCQEECLPEKINLKFSLPISTQSEQNPQYLPELLIAENTFPLPVQSSVQITNNQAQITFSDGLLADCAHAEFVSHHSKKSVISNLPHTTIIEKNKINISFDEGELPRDFNGILLCDAHTYALSPIQTPLTDKSSSLPEWLYYLFTAFLAGLILNLMPCVLPILSLKALYLAAHKEKASLSSVLIYLFGVLCSLLFLSGMLFYLRNIGSQLGWGFQLQSPVFNIFLFILFFLIFLNLIDCLPLPATFTDKLSRIAGNKSFLTGFFAVIVACPCTGPFMGAALGYALREPPLIYFIIFLSLGFGYALPYVLIEAFPRFFLKFIPKPGAWMITLKRILALPILLTCLWLLWVTWHQIGTSKQNKELLWETYTPQKIEQSLQKGEPVLIDFTAKWCLICLLNDKTVLSSKEFKTLVKENNLRLFKADWTNHNPEIADALKTYNRNSIPLYIYYQKNSSVPQYLPQILTIDTLKDIIQ